MAKATRRDLRRAIDPSAVDHVQELDSAIGVIQNAVVSLQREVAALAVHHAKEREARHLASSATTDLIGAIAADLATMKAQQARPFWQRFLTR